MQRSPARGLAAQDQVSVQQMRDLRGKRHPAKLFYLQISLVALEPPMKQGEKV